MKKAILLGFTLLFILSACTNSDQSGMNEQTQLRLQDNMSENQARY